MRTIFSITILVLVLTAFSELTLAAPQTTLFFEPQNSSVAVNNSFSLKLKLNPGSNKVTAVELYLSFDTNKLKLNSITPSSAFSVILQPASIDNSQGKASIVLGVPPTSPVTAVSDVLTLSFKTKANTGTGLISVANNSRAVAIGETGNVINSFGSVQITITSSSPIPLPSPTPFPSLSPGTSPSLSPSPLFSPAPARSPSLPEEDLFPRLREYIEKNINKLGQEEETSNKEPGIVLAFFKQIYSVFFSLLKKIFGIK